MRMRIGAAVVGVLALSGVARAHHEAIFGPQSSLVLSAPAFVSVQTYTRGLGPAGARTEETNVLVSAGLQPFSSVPLSFTAIAPASYISGPNGRIGLEDLVLGARWRQGLGDGDGNFVMGMGALELPTGSIDHPAFDGPLTTMAAGLVSAESGPVSGIAYAFYRHNGRKPDGTKRGDNLFLGGGAAWTPIDEPATERLLSFQLGFSWEETMDAGTGVYLHPTVVWGPGGQNLLFAVVSVPVAQDFMDPATVDHFRIGLGLVHLFR